MISWPPYPLLIYVEGLGDCYLIYVKDNGMHEDDEAVVALKNGGQWRHVLVSAIKSFNNATYSIKKQ